jgi:hypothetical protein
MRRVRLTGSLTPEERALAAKGRVPSKAEQKRYLRELAAAIERLLAESPGKLQDR